MSREIFQSDNYFEEYIEEQNERIEKFKNVLNDISRRDIQKIAQCERILANLYKDLFSASYSLGVSKDKLMEIFKLYIDSVLNSSISDYTEMVDILSLSIILDIDKGKIEPVLKNGDYDDGLVLSLKSYIIGDYHLSDKKLLYTDYYSVFYLYLKGRKTVEEILNYLENDWYNASDEFAWYDSHNSSENIYVGYWCWLGAAVLKMKSASQIKGKYIPLEI